MSRRARGAVAAPLCALWIGWSAPSAAVEFDRGELRLELSGRFTSIYTLTRETRAEDLALRASTRRSDSWGLLSRARIDLQAAWRDRVSARVIYDNEVRTGTALRSIGFAIGDAIGTRTWWDADRTISQHADADWRHALYRAWVRVEGDGYEVTLGRQRIALGRARLWNPTDLFNPIFPLAIEGGQRIGQDSVVARRRLAPGVWGVAIWSPQDDPDDHRMALRVEYGSPALDAALMGGRFGRDYVVGADFAGDLGGAGIRGEATYTDLGAGPRIWQVVASVDYNAPVGTGLYVLLEHLWNENTLGGAFAPLLPSAAVEPVAKALARLQGPLLKRVVTTVQNLSGLQLAYELHPLVQMSALWLYDWHGASLAFAPSLVYSAFDDVNVTLATQVFVGRRHATEFGDRSGLLIVSIEVFF